MVGNPMISNLDLLICKCIMSYKQKHCLEFPLNRMNKSSIKEKKTLPENLNR